MQIIREYSKAITNPDKCKSHVIRNAWVDGSKLVIEGFEQYANMDYDNKVKTDFERVIDENYTL